MYTHRKPILASREVQVNLFSLVSLFSFFMEYQITFTEHVLYSINVGNLFAILIILIVVTDNTCIKKNTGTSTKWMSPERHLYIKHKKGRT